MDISCPYCGFPFKASFLVDPESINGSGLFGVMKWRRCPECRKVVTICMQGEILISIYYSNIT